MSALTEFGLIRRYFSRPTDQAVLGVGDDAALLQPSPGCWLAVSTDTLVAGVHFFADAEPEALGWKALAVNLSDMAAMGADPRWVTLALTLPVLSDDWLAAFAAGWYACAGAFGASLVGGDTTRGPLSIGVTVLGEVPVGQALRRDGAQVGDEIWVSGTLGDAALALAARQGRLQLDLADEAALAGRLDKPQPRVALGKALRGLAHSAIDLSDGLLADLGHVAERSGVAAVLDSGTLPLSDAARRQRGYSGLIDCVLAGGDDYELCFTAAPSAAAEIVRQAAALGVAVCRIGRIEAGNGVQVHDAAGRPMNTGRTGYDHFAA